MAEPKAELSDLQFTKLCGIIHKHTGITIAEGRKSLLLSRLRSRLRDLDGLDFKAYIDRVGIDKSELQELINRVTTNKTLFYRTPRIWNHFREVAVEEFIAKKTMLPLRVWSAAASSGEEAYTAGMVLEQFREAHSGFDYKIMGTDISSRVLAHGKGGTYSDQVVANFRKDHPDMFASHMSANDAGGFRIARPIKSRVTFKLHNLQKRMLGARPFDVVFLRNVLIYFTNEGQEQILANIHTMMPADGTLYIGESESLSRLSTDFEIVEPMVYRPRHGQNA